MRRYLIAAAGALTLFITTAGAAQAQGPNAWIDPNIGCWVHAEPYPSLYLPTWNGIDNDPELRSYWESANAAYDSNTVLTTWTTTDYNLARVHAHDDFYGQTGWIALNSPNGCHATDMLQAYNLTFLAGTDPRLKARVTNHELGHAFGLDHWCATPPCSTPGDSMDPDANNHLTMWWMFPASYNLISALYTNH